MIDKEFTYYEVEWTDADRRFHADYFIPAEIPLMQTSFYHKCDDPKKESTDFMITLVKNGMLPCKLDKKTTTVKLKESK